MTLTLVSILFLLGGRLSHMPPDKVGIFLLVVFGTIFGGMLVLGLLIRAIHGKQDDPHA